CPGRGRTRGGGVAGARHFSRGSLTTANIPDGRPRGLVLPSPPASGGGGAGGGGAAFAGPRAYPLPPTPAPAQPRAAGSGAHPLTPTLAPAKPGARGKGASRRAAPAPTPPRSPWPAYGR